MFLPVLVPLARQESKESNAPPIYFVRETYLRKLSRYNLTPLLVSPLIRVQHLEKLYRQSCGALFTGGGDFDARYYGHKNHPSNSGLDEIRDELELYLLRRIMNDRKPFLGICRGAQALVIASGGILEQNITPEKYGGEIHEATTYDGSLENICPVDVAADSKAAAIIGTEDIKVNCAHHQAAFTLGPGLRAAGITPGGVIEIIEDTEPGYFCFGIQSHPELLNDGPLEPMFSAFSKAVKKYAKNR